MTETSEEQIRHLLQEARTIAVVGHSDKPYRTSYRIGNYLRRVGYKVYPVNPTISDVDGERVYPNLAALPERINIVNVFRRAEYLADVVNQAIAINAKAIWGQLGVYDPEAERAARAAGLVVVTDRCIMVDHGMLVR
jgi:predicted CoA-binding protein